MSDKAFDEEAIFKVACQIASPAARALYLSQVCGDAPLVLKRMSALLHVHDEESRFLEIPPPGLVNSPTIDHPPLEQPGTQIGPYKLFEQIGEGGMGTVWMAQQSEPVKRLVAVKLIKSGLDSRQVLARFEAERQALALMDHPNIAKVLDAGTASDSGRPYVVMELVKGVPITHYCDEHHLTPRQRLELFIPVCQAIQHAHQKGIIHRDIKPNNVLVASYDDKPVPKIIDFGVAKATGQRLTDLTLNTGFGAVVGTLEYMSPEQAGFNQLDVDTRSDIYSLGVLLYELLSGSPPFQRKDLEQAGLLEMLRVIREQEPSKPSTKLSSSDALPSLSANRGTEPARLTNLLRGELDWIVMKTLEKDRGRRYETANGFAQDLQRYLEDEPVLACPPSVRYRFLKFARRNKAALTMLSLVICFIVLSGGVVGWGLRDKAAREKEIAAEAAKKQLLTEQGIREAIERGNRIRAELHSVLAGPSGVQHLLNQPARWELFIKLARGELAQGLQLSKRAEFTLGPDLTHAIEELDENLTHDFSDYELAKRLEAIRLGRATQVDGRFNYPWASKEYRQAFASLAVFADDLGTPTSQIVSSPIKEQLVAGIDDWARVAFVLHDDALAERLLGLARKAAPDPLRADRLRQIQLWRDPIAMKELVSELPAAGLSSPLLALIGSVLRNDEGPLKESWMRQAQAEHPDDFWLNFELAESLAKTKPVEAAGFHRVALALRPNNSAVWINLGNTFYYQDKWDAAAEWYRKAIENDPKELDAYLNLGQVLRKKQLWDEAIAALRTAISIDPQSADGHAILGAALLEKGLPAEAHAAYRKSLQLEPNNVERLNNLAWQLATSEELGFRDPAWAIENAKKVVELAPQLGTYWNTLGVACYRGGYWNEAVTSLNKSMELGHGADSIRDWIFLSMVHWQLGEKDAARKWYDKSVAWMDQHRPLDEDLQRFRAEADGQWDPAVIEGTQAIELAPNSAEAWSGRAYAHFHGRRWENAIADFTKAIELAPEVHGNWWHRGHTYLQLRQWKEAQSDFEYILERWPEGGEGWYLRAVALTQLNKFDEAMADIQKASSKGFSQWKNDPRLFPLHQRDDYVKLLEVVSQEQPE